MRSLILAGLASILVAGLFACAHNRTLPAWHPVEVTETPTCSECHKDEWAVLNHTPDFGTRHKFYAARQSAVCNLCHAETFCADCHAHKEEVKPSDKYKDSPERALPHRGDYFSQHMIDGKINPASCFPCHGRMNNERCKVCHR